MDHTQNVHGSGDILCEGEWRDHTQNVHGSGDILCEGESRRRHSYLSGYSGNIDNKKYGIVHKCGGGKGGNLVGRSGGKG